MPSESLQHTSVLLLMIMPVTCNDSQSAVVEALEIERSMRVCREVEGRGEFARDVILK